MTFDDLLRRIHWFSFIWDYSRKLKNYIPKTWKAVWQDYEVRVNDEFVLRGNAWATWSRLSRGRRVRARCLVALIGVKTKNHHHLTLALLCFGCSCEPVVPGPCARWIRVARQRWASSMFDPVLRQRFCHRRHLGGRWWDSHYGRQPRYWFKKPPTKTHSPSKKTKK